MTGTNRTHGAKWLARILGLGQLLIAIAVAASAGWLLVTCPVWFSDPPRLPLPVEWSISPGPDFLTLEDSASPFREYEVEKFTGELAVKFAGAWTQWVFIFFALQEFLLILLILMFLQKIVGSIATGEAFSNTNAKRLRWVGGLLILEALFGPGASALISLMALRGVETFGGTMTVDWFGDFAQGGFISGWIVLILSEVFRRGAEMQDDQSLTI